MEEEKLRNAGFEPHRRATATEDDVFTRSFVRGLTAYATGEISQCQVIEMPPRMEGLCNGQPELGK